MAFQLTVPGMDERVTEASAGATTTTKKRSESIGTKWRMQVLQPHRSSAQFCNLMHYVYDGDVVVFDAAALKWREGARAISKNG